MSEILKPSKEEQKIALTSYDALEESLSHITEEFPEIEIEETKEKIRIPINSLRLLAKILKDTSQGIPVSIVPIATKITTQKAADILGCSRPHLVKLLEKGKINYIKVGKHRRILYEDVLKYKKKEKEKQKKLLIKIMNSDEELENYDT